MLSRRRVARGMGACSSAPNPTVANDDRTLVHIVSDKLICAIGCALVAPEKLGTQG
jgi:hypothetical protein